jgi:hypothetical protein
MKDRSRTLLDLSDILVLWSFAVAQPLYDLLGKHPPFLVAHRADGPTLALLVLVLSFLLPLCIFAGEALLEKFSARLRRLAHLLFIALLIAMTVFPPVKRTVGAAGFGGVAVVTGFSFGIAALYLFWRRRALSLAILLPVVLLFPVLFLFFTPARGLWLEAGAQQGYPEVSAKTPVVVVVFDELPLVSLLDENRMIDAGRFPSFAWFSQHATWYRNASTVSESTPHSLPAIVGGRYPSPEQGRLPNARDYPESLFALLGGSYDFNVIEAVTELCPRSLLTGLPHRRARLSTWFSDLAVVYLHALLPTVLSEGLPSISHTWRNFAAGGKPSVLGEPKASFEAYLGRITGGDRALHFLHVNLPHYPWVYLPSGRQYSLYEDQIEAVAGTDETAATPDTWTTEEWLVAQSYQRHLLQVGMVDWLLGRLLSRLREEGVLDSAVVVVTADHGVSFQPGQPRRLTTPDNHPEILGVPLFIKAPHQDVGFIDDRNVETIDILPTVAELLGESLPWETDGHSLVGLSGPERPHKVLVADHGPRLEFDASLDLQPALFRKLEWFGSGSWDSVYMRDLELARAPVEKTQDAVPIGYRIEREAFFRNVDLNAPLVLTHITGLIRRPAPAPFRPLQLAVKVNGTLAAATRTRLVRGEERFSAVISDQHLVAGRNRLELFSVREAPDGRRLRLLAGERSVFDWGEKLDFGSEGKGTEFRSRGWSAPEADFVWSNGLLSELVLPATAPGAPVMLTARLKAFVSKQLPRQRIRVLINGQVAGEWLLEADEFRDLNLLIPNSFFGDPAQTVVTFETPDATSPKALGLSDDIRVLGFCLHSMTLERAVNVPGYEWGEVLKFGSENDLKPLQSSGWAVPEAGFTWNDGTRATVDLLIGRPTDKSVTLQAFLKPFLAGTRKEQRVRVIANGEPVDEWNLRIDDFQAVITTIPAKLLKQPVVRLVFETPDAVSPAELGVGVDERRLAIALATLRLTETGQAPERSEGKW